MPKPTAFQVAKEVAEATKELHKEGVLDEWGAAFGLHMANNIYRRRRAKAEQAKPVREAAE